MKVPGKFLLFLMISLLSVSCTRPKKSPDVHEKSISTNTLALHFWKKFNFKNADLTNQNEAMESLFIDYLQVLTNADKSFQVNSINIFLDSTINCENSVFQYYVSLFEKYLYNPNSPIRNEELYLDVLQYLTQSEAVDNTYKIRYKYQLEMISKNRVGEIASDFDFILANGKKEKLSQTQAKYLIVFFNNPDCHDCVRVKEILSLINHPKVKILSIYPNENLTIWKRTSYPETWINGYNTETIRLLYDLKAIPTLYLLDQDKRIILKDADVEEIIKYMNHTLAS